ncbi:MAG: C2 family cysteine protease [Bacteroidota bacterium]|jgi:hypothetical protein
MQETQTQPAKVQTQFNEPRLSDSQKNYRHAVSLPAQFAVSVMQLQLDLYKPYKAINAVNAFSAVNGVNSNRQIAQNEIITPIIHNANHAKTQLYNHDQLRKMFMTTAGNDANFQAVGATLADEEQKAYNVLAPVADIQIDYTDFYKDMANEPLPAIGHVRQGEIGDCWLIAAMAAMANSPHWGHQLLPKIQSQNATNSYNVTLGVYNANAAPGAVLNQVVVNNMTGHLPVLPNGNPNAAAELAYAQQTLGIPASFGANANNTPVWPAMLEKAYAIDQGGYQALDNRDAREGLAVLSGIMPEQYTGATVDAPRWTAIQQQLAAGAAVTLTSKANNVLANGVAAMTHGTEGHVDGTAHNLIEDHVYVLTAMTNTHITLQNPHGHSHPGQLQIADLPSYIAQVDVLPAPPPAQPVLAAPAPAQPQAVQPAPPAPAPQQQQQQAIQPPAVVAPAPQQQQQAIQPPAVIAPPPQQQQQQAIQPPAVVAPAPQQQQQAIQPPAVIAPPPQQQQAQVVQPPAVIAPAPQQQQQQAIQPPLVAPQPQQQQAQALQPPLAYPAPNALPIVQQNVQAVLPAVVQQQVQFQAQQLLQMHQPPNPQQLQLQALLQALIPQPVQQQLQQQPHLFPGQNSSPAKRSKPNPNP